ncbi:hypothetical protein RJT34_18921 [Clitoria ternatea]|uniref:Uncharacterized protein n=1 Tax=Clitoria ternatea TaxID=43366 RepID=A0AAN9P2W7_CLITE
MIMVFFCFSCGESNTSSPLHLSGSRCHISQVLFSLPLLYSWHNMHNGAKLLKLNVDNFQSIASLERDQLKICNW